MRILLVGDYPADPRLGSPKVLFKLQEAFRELGHACDLVLSPEIGTHPRNSHLRQAVAPISAWSAVRRAVRTHGPYDIVDVASAEGLWIGAWRRSIGNSAVVSRSNGLEHLNYQRMLDDHDAGLVEKPWSRRLFHPLVRLTQVAAAARTADRLLLLNALDRTFAVKRGWKEETDIDIVPHGVSSALLDTAPPKEGVRGRGILFCGSWNSVKGVDYLVKAYELLLGQGTTVGLTILGGAVAESTIRSAFSPETRRHVTIVDRASEEVVVETYRDHDVLAWTSTYEGFGMVLIEAMSQRLPVVATPVGCASSMIEHERTGLLVPARDPAALASALTRILRNQGLAESMADAACERVRHMSWKNTAEQTLLVYQRALDARARAC